MGIYALTPASGQLELTPGKSKKFSFTLLDSLIVNSIDIYDRKTKDKEEVTFLQADNIVSFNYEFKKLKKQLINTYVNSHLVATYRVLEKKEEK